MAARHLSPFHVRFRHKLGEEEVSGLKLRGEWRFPDQRICRFLTDVANGFVSFSWRTFVSSLRRATAARPPQPQNLLERRGKESFRYAIYRDLGFSSQSQDDGHVVRLTNRCISLAVGGCSSKPFPRHRPRGAPAASAKPPTPSSGYVRIRCTRWRLWVNGRILSRIRAASLTGACRRALSQSRTPPRRVACGSRSGPARGDPLRDGGTSRPIPSSEQSKSLPTNGSAASMLRRRSLFTHGFGW